MPGWGYRVVNRDGMLGIHEQVRERGELPKPRVRRAEPVGRTVQELRADLQAMLAALDLAVLDFDDVYPMGAQRRG